jgi:hypothetical protein
MTTEASMDSRAMKLERGSFIETSNWAWARTELRRKRQRMRRMAVGDAEY